MDYWAILKIVMILNPISNLKNTNFTSSLRRILRFKDNSMKEKSGLIIAMETIGGPMQHLKTNLTHGDLPSNPLAQSAWANLASC
ncbi:hypothetical protein VP01_514g7 [Puccinia sorghi]|uniref:Uncharacterized protein n=1 Tax=Puccinia sorghi TaxID=27349 RepID=A0A0L6ULQ6_9BASI|nr:hypothetical protein VP01_514g7 [Puccinia sorghi]